MIRQDVSGDHLVHSIFRNCDLGYRICRAASAYKNVWTLGSWTFNAAKLAAWFNPAQLTDAEFSYFGNYLLKRNYNDNLRKNMHDCIENVIYRWIDSHVLSINSISRSSLQFKRAYLANTNFSFLPDVLVICSIFLFVFRLIAGKGKKKQSPDKPKSQHDVTPATEWKVDGVWCNPSRSLLNGRHQFRTNVELRRTPISLREQFR